MTNSAKVFKVKIAQTDIFCTHLDIVYYYLIVSAINGNRNANCSFRLFLSRYDSNQGLVIDSFFYFRDYHRSNNPGGVVFDGTETALVNAAVYQSGRTDVPLWVASYPLLEAITDYVYPEESIYTDARGICTLKEHQLEIDKLQGKTLSKRTFTCEEYFDSGGP